MFSTCDFHVDGSSGQSISSDSRYCDPSWVITAPLNHTIRLKFETFQLSDSQELEQNLIRIYDGRKATNTSLGVFTGARRPFTIQSSGRFMLVKQTTKNRYWWLEHPSNFKGVYTFNTTKGKPVTFELFRAISIWGKVLVFIFLF